MTQAIPDVTNKPQITTAEFVELKIYNDFNDTSDVSIHTFSSAYKPETINGRVYLPMGGLLEVGGQHRDLAATSADAIISLSGISGNNMQVVLGTKIRGSEIKILRGFYDENMVLGNTYPRLTGIITAYSVTEEREGQSDNFTVAVAVSSYKTVLENRIAGRKTNQSSWQFFNPNDTSMNRVYSIAGVQFDFGHDAQSSTPVSGGGSTGPGGPPGAGGNPGDSIAMP